MYKRFMNLSKLTKMFLLIDNYDSFTYNIVHYLAEIGVEVTVQRNDRISIDEINKLAPQAIFLPRSMHSK